MSSSSSSSSSSDDGEAQEVTKGQFKPDFASPDPHQQPLILYQADQDNDQDQDQDKGKSFLVCGLLNGLLRPYQRQGVRFLFEKCFCLERPGGAILADDMGLGKTVQVSRKQKNN